MASLEQEFRLLNSQYVVRALVCASPLVLMVACGGGSADSSLYNNADTAMMSDESVEGVRSQSRNKPTTTTSSTTTTTTSTTPTTTTSTTSTTTSGRVLSVGPGKNYSTPCGAFSAAANGDVIEIEGGVTYSGDVCGIYRDNLIIKGVNGRPRINANGANALGKGTWVVIGTNTTIDNVEMSGAKVPDKNGAAIRLDGKHLTIRNSYFHQNENGILTSNDGVSNIVIERSEFGNNGYGDGYSHNVYIGRVNSLVFSHNYSHDAKVGHNLKSRAQQNIIAYNRFSSSGSAATSYEIDLPNAGLAHIIGNIVHQGANHSNPGLLTFGVEGATNAKQELYVVNNTFLNDDSSRGYFISVGSQVTTPVLLQNNIFAGVGNVVNQSAAIDKTNYRSLSPMFVDRDGFDLRPASGSPMVNAGSEPGKTSTGVSLKPVLHYQHVASSESRPLVGQIDIGAYETTAP